MVNFFFHRDPKIKTAQDNSKERISMLDLLQFKGGGNDFVTLGA